jgi:hypothetical protein
MNEKIGKTLDFRNEFTAAKPPLYVITQELY